MTRQFIETTIFAKRWNELGLDDDTLLQLQDFILKNPETGDIIQGTGGVTKLRWRLPHAGKSGGVRVLHVDFVHQKKIVLLNCYGKSVKDSLSDKEKAAFKELVKQIGKELK